MGRLTIRWGVWLLLCALPARGGVVFQNVFDGSLAANLGPADVGRWESAFVYAEGVLSGLFTNAVTVNVTLAATNDPTVLGQSDPSFVGPYGFAALAAALPGLPASDPTAGGSYWLTSAQAKALGVTTSGSDGTVTMGTGFDYTFDPNLRAVVGDYDFIGIALHEITEVMGRVGLLGTDLGYGPAYGAMDLFGYTAPGQVSVNQTSTGVYFSTDRGATALRYFNDPGNGGDLRDWASGQGADAFNAFVFAGQESDGSAVDVRSMEAIGWTAVPEPGTWVVGVILVVLGAARMGGGERHRQ